MRTTKSMFTQYIQILSRIEDYMVITTFPNSLELD